MRSLFIQAAFIKRSVLSCLVLSEHLITFAEAWPRFFGQTSITLPSKETIYSPNNY